jgi:hypothetical protein
MVGNDPLDYVDPFGLWQLTATFGLPIGGPSVQFTFGNSASWYSGNPFGGQWNGGAKIGVGQVGTVLSATFDPLAHKCHPSGTTVLEETINADIGLGSFFSGGIEQVANGNMQDPLDGEFKIGGTLSIKQPVGLKPIGIGGEFVPTDPEHPFQAQQSFTFGESVFFGVGATYNGNCPCNK